MKRLVLGVVLSALLAGCSEEKAPSAVVIAKPAGDATAGKAVAERDCKPCHGLDGRGLAPGIPNLAAQREPYLLLALTEYREVKRAHAALRDLAGRLTEAERRNVVAYYAAQPPVAAASGKDVQQTSLLEKGKALAAACVKCHGEEGNSKTPGIPSLAGQQPHYLVTAIGEYHRGERNKAPMEAILRDTNPSDLESLALYFASRTPVQRPAPSVGDPSVGEPLTAMCGGCHGPNGDSSDAATPSLAGQDPRRRS